MKLRNGLDVLNATGHELTLLDCKWVRKSRCKGGDCISCSEGYIETVEPSGLLAKADIVERKVDADIPNNVEDKVEFVTVKFMPRETVEATLKAVSQKHLVLGSIIAAQAYPGLVAALVPLVGTKGNCKIMRSDKFTIFNEGSDTING